MVTRRIRHLINVAHDGNIREASATTRLPYATLRDLYLGRTVNPGLETLRALAAPYSIRLEWFTDETRQDTVPVSGWVGYLPERPGIRERDPYQREVLIPFAARPMIEVFEALEKRLEALPATPDRPILGDATNDQEMVKRLTTFLLGPLLAAERIGDRHAILPITALQGDRDPNPEAEEEWVGTLRVLGAMWKTVLGDLLNQRARLGKR